jgi:AcrR family transcriptional regulator
LFAERGFDATSLREIAERIGITKAALYYHYASKDALLSDLIEPMFADLAAFAEDLEANPAGTRDILERYWDLCMRHRLVMRVLIHHATVIVRADITPRILHWRERIDAVLVGGDAPVDRVRAVVALGGLQDVVIVFGEEDPTVRATAVDAAVRALSA